MTRRRLRVLLAEGSPGELASALHALYAGSDPGLDLTVVSTIATLLPTIKVVDPEVILLDLALNLREPMDAVHLVHRTAPGVPLIVVADPSQKEEAVRSLAEGALDYVLRGHIDAHTMERVLRAALERNTLKGLTDLLRDRVTGLYTRDGFLTVGMRRHEEAMRAGSSLMLICVFFENLQALRETSGRGAEDRALNDVAKLLKGSCRRSAAGSSSTLRYTIRRARHGAPLICGRASVPGARRIRARSLNSWTASSRVCGLRPKRCRPRKYRKPSRIANTEWGTCGCPSRSLAVVRWEQSMKATLEALQDEHARAREALRLSEARNRDLVENSVYGIFRVSDEGAFLDRNPALLRILGCASAEDLLSLNLGRDVFRFPEQYIQVISACRERGQVHGAEAEWRRRDGGLVTVRLNVRRISSIGCTGELEVIAEDVTELRAMERQLRQARKFEAVGQLAGGMAHDFNNVVGAILGWAELGVEENSDNPQVAERFARIREQAERAAALTRELLAFARRQVLQPRALDLNTVTGGLINFLDKMIGKDIEFKSLNAKLDPVKADPTQIEQVLMNLCLNARDAMPHGGRMVIETEMVELDNSYCWFYPYVVAGRYAVISVSDTGVGMDAETRERIFEPFFTMKARGEGTGMGLATAYGIVKQHGGFIHMYSEPGHGSLFRVYLPVMQGALGDKGTEKAPAPSLSGIRGSETILLAEDHESIREMARNTLVSMGYRVLSACDGQEALKLCAQETPALAILDLVMPKLGGPATAEGLLEMHPDLPLVFTSGYSAAGTKVPYTCGNARYLQKPYSPTTLGRLVRETLDQHHSQAHRAGINNENQHLIKGPTRLDGPVL